MAALTAVAQAAVISPCDLAIDSAQQRLFVLEADASQVVVLECASLDVVQKVALPAKPSGMALSADRTRLYVTGGQTNGVIFVIDTKKGTVIRKIKAGHWPVAPVVSPDGTRLFVCNRFENKVSVVNLKGRLKRVSIDVPREPIAAAITANSGGLYVLNALPQSPANEGYTSCVVSVIDPAVNKVVASVTLPNGSNQLLGICFSPDGRYAYATHILARYQLPTTQLERGWMNTNAMSVIDTKSRKLVNTVLLDDVGLGAANPWGIGCTADGQWIVVAHAGTHEISVIDRKALHERLTGAATGEKVTHVSKSAADVPNDLSFLTGIKRRIKLPGKGPRALAIDKSQVYLAEYYSDSLAKVDLSAEGKITPMAKALGTGEPESLARTGERLFNDAGLCFQSWQSCGSCHTSDARVDALNWDLLNDGLGNPKNTKSLLLAHQTPPVMSLGVRDTAEEAVRAGIRHIQFAVRPESEAQAIDAYLKSLTPVPSPHLDGGKLSRSARRGKKLFSEANCVMCHSGPHHTNMKSYNVGTGIDREKDAAFDTPTLVEIWRSGPYLHDGRAVTIHDVLTRFNTSQKHGQTQNLSDKQMADLETYVLSL
ncbi:MAG: c-type cytochrome [Phycisphaeraceae bacterium]|nr:c-type cytochrome [Phycisphaeraceae bacterium]